MKVNSTGLGNTTLTAHIAGIGPGDQPGDLTMKIDSTEPVHWNIVCRMDPGDIRAAIKMVMRPAVAFRIARMALGPARKAAALDAAAEAKRNG
jgi:hypothetical protein